MRPAALVTAVRAMLAAAGLATVLSFGALPAAAVAANSGGIQPASVGANGRLNVAVIVPITVPRSTGGLVSAEQLTRYTADAGVLTQELDQVENVPSVALAIDPRIIASIRVLGTEAPATARAWLERLAALPNETFPLAYADADPVLLGQAGRSESIAPLSFDYAIDAADFGDPAPTASPSPTATADPNARPALPQTPEQVLSWNWTFDDIAWPASSTVVAADLPRLKAAGYDTVVLDEANAGGTVGHVSFATTGSAPAGLVADSALSTAASAVADAGDFAEAEQGVPSLQAAVTAAAADAGSATRVVTLSRASDARAFLRSMSLAMSGSGADLVTLQTALDSVPSAATLVDKPESQQRIGAVGSMLDALAAESIFSRVAVVPSDVTSPRQLAFLSLLNTEWVGADAWTAQTATFLTQSSKLRNSVSIVASSSATALGANPQLPVTVRNQLGVPIRVYAVARPLSGKLVIPDDRRRVEVTVQANSSQTGRIQTQSVANGTVRVEVALEAADGTSVGQSSTIKVDVQAGWETIGTLIAVVVVLGVFGFGVTRNIVRRRAARRNGDRDEAADA